MAKKKTVKSLIEHFSKGKPDKPARKDGLPEIRSKIAGLRIAIGIMNKNNQDTIASAVAIGQQISSSLDSFQTNLMDMEVSLRGIENASWQIVKDMQKVLVQVTKGYVLSSTVSRASGSPIASIQARYTGLANRETAIEEAKREEKKDAWLDQFLNATKELTSTIKALGINPYSLAGLAGIVIAAFTVLIGTVIGFVGGAFEAILGAKFIGKALGKITQLFEFIFGPAGILKEKIVGFLAGKFWKQLSWLGELADKLFGANGKLGIFSKIFGSILAEGSGLVKFVETISKLFGVAVKFGRVLGKAIVPLTIAIALFEGIWAGFSKYQETGSVLDGIIAGITGVIDSLTLGLIDGEKLFQVIKPTITAMWDSLKQIWDGIKDIFHGNIISGFSKIFGGIFNSMLTTFDFIAIEVPIFVADTISKLFMRLTSWFASVLGFESFSKDLDAIIADFDLKRIIVETIENLVAMISDFWTSLLGGVASALDYIPSQFRTENIDKFIKSNLNGSGNAVEQTNQKHANSAAQRLQDRTDSTGKKARIADLKDAEKKLNGNNSLTSESLSDMLQSTTDKIQSLSKAGVKDSDPEMAALLSLQGAIKAKSIGAVSASNIGMNPSNTTASMFSNSEEQKLLQQRQASAKTNPAITAITTNNIQTGGEGRSLQIYAPTNTRNQENSFRTVQSSNFGYNPAF